MSYPARRFKRNVFVLLILYFSKVLQPLWCYNIPTLSWHRNEQCSFVHRTHRCTCWWNEKIMTSQVQLQPICSWLMSSNLRMVWIFFVGLDLLLLGMFGKIRHAPGIALCLYLGIYLFGMLHVVWSHVYIFLSLYRNRP